MSKTKPQVVICRTCLRDNPGEGSFANFETNAQTYDQAFREGWLKRSARLNYQNCFAQCENFYCVQVTLGNWGYLFKKINTPSKMERLVQWVKEVNAKGELKLPKELEESVLGPVSLEGPAHRYKKI